ncbi:hypothetical protein WM40_07465 [Robbsia andropogonis]|uniref:Transcriptional regulator n=1 Tax=Robbsia andropogonis TaxID=28092 RepID=A0A0F5K2G4_9BURK|nr:response regulator transcription factor [Robbsia andropogonis]KKB64288.1 hypothetical protein WM40_07465 [Robbsia andropogonis]MCP1119599.1 response regulator transcription factor [Robbsia andropogonis]MCP1129582.1 response regulator transcription factor [Robbsia andropogonis]
MKILIIDADRTTAWGLRDALTQAGHTVDTCVDGRTGRHDAVETQHDLLVIATALPDISGLALMREIQQRRPTPTLMLSDRDNLSERLDALHEGADDIIHKPFALAEAVARVNAILRRGPIRAPTRLQVADLQLDLTQRKAQRRAHQILLTAKEFSLLWLLMRRASQVLTRTTILAHVWDTEFDSDANVVDAAIRRLRAKIDLPGIPCLIHTVRGMGYVLEPR